MVLKLYHAEPVANSLKALIPFHARGIPFESVYVDLHKFEQHEPWFVAINPEGQVPVLDHDGTIITHSTVINEYLDEVTEGSMLPADPLERAHSRAWIEFANALLSDAFSVTSAKDDAALAEILAKLGGKLDRLERETRGAPFFLGPEVSLVDAAFTPALQRLSWANEIHPAMAIFDGRPKVANWWNALAERDSVQGSAVADLRQQFDRMVGRDRGGYQSVVGARCAVRPGPAHDERVRQSSVPGVGCGVAERRSSGGGRMFDVYVGQDAHVYAQVRAPAERVVCLSLDEPLVGVHRSGVYVDANERSPRYRGDRHRRSSVVAQHVHADGQ